MLRIVLFCLLSVAVFARVSLSEQFPHLSQETIEHYKNSSKNFPAIDAMYRNFDNLSLEEKKELKKGVKSLFPQKLIHQYLKEDKQTLREFYALYLWFMNYKAFVLVDKYYKDSDFIEAKILATLVHKLLPSNISYYDTYLWSLVRSKEYTKALQEYPKLIATAKDKDEIESLKKHYEYVLKQKIE